MGEERKRGDVLKLPVRRTREKRINQDRRLSEIVEEMALRLLKKPDAIPSMAAVQAAQLLASATWNFASGEPGLRERHREMLKKLDWCGVTPWAELLSADTDQFAQNQVSVMSEQLTALDEMAPFAEIVAKAEDLYMPGGPPMSPLTTSYFTCWAFFDACVEPTGETIGTIVLEMGAAFGMHTELLRLIGLMQQSRMGVYLHEGTEGSLVVLREPVTDAVCHAIVPAGYRGQNGELWYARVLPPPIPGSSEHVVFTTSYILLKPGLREWRAYFRRTLPDAPRQARLEAYEYHMKFGPTRSYWNDFVFEGYVNYRTEAIYLAGLPDLPKSRPHSEVNNRSSRR